MTVGINMQPNGCTWSGYVQPPSCVYTVAMEVTRDVVLPVSMSEAWQLLTDERELAEWLGVTVDLDVTPGAATAFVERDGTVRRAVFDVVEDEHRLGFVWWTDEGAPTRVE